MGASSTLTTEIASEINALGTGCYGEVMFEGTLLSDIPEADYFMNPIPDVTKTVGTDRTEIESVLAERPSLLGIYIPMRSPGQIILIRRNLRGFYWSLVKSLWAGGLRYITPSDLHGALQLVIGKTYQHELFHYRCDVLRQVFGGQYDALLEEALAVAWSRLWILDQDRRTSIGKMNRVFFYRLIEMAYAYKSPGYRDWANYANIVSFKIAMLNYVAPANYQQLQANGVEVEEIVFQLLDTISGGYVEKVV